MISKHHYNTCLETQKKLINWCKPEKKKYHDIIYFVATALENDTFNQKRNWKTKMSIVNNSFAKVLFGKILNHFINLKIKL